jgi:hypothetical protein
MSEFHLFGNVNTISNHFCSSQSFFGVVDFRYYLFCNPEI